MTQWNLEWTASVFCPKCRGTNLESNGAEMPEWISDTELAVGAEYLTCKDCGHEFSIGTSYNLAGFCFLNEEGPCKDTDYNIIGVNGGATYNAKLV